MVEPLDQAFADLRQFKVDLGLHRHIALGAGGSVIAGEPRQAVEGVAD